MPADMVTLNVEQRESIKLIKMTKGYNWEIRVLSLDVEKIKKINEQLVAEFGA